MSRLPPEDLVSLATYFVDKEILSNQEGFHVEGDMIIVEPGKQARLTFVFRVKKEANLDQWQLMITDGLPLPLKVAEKAATN